MGRKSHFRPPLFTKKNYLVTLKYSFGLYRILEKIIKVPKFDQTWYVWRLKIHIFTHGPWRWNHGSTDGPFHLLLLLLLLLLHTTKFLFSLRYRKCQFSNWFDFPGNSSDSYIFLLLLLLFPEVYLSGELSTPVQRTVHRLQAVQWLLLLFSTIQPWAGYITGSDLAHK